MKTKNNQRFFSNTECEYFPCHKVAANSDFNCLFCYCPLYFLGDDCGGIINRVGPDAVKDCTNCHLPHLPEYYDTIITKLQKARAGTRTD